MINKKFIPFIILGTLGIIDSLYLLISHSKPEDVVCIGLNECDVVLTSIYSTIFNIPTAAFGLVYYTFIAMIFTVLLEKSNEGLEKIALISTTIGVLASSWFTYLQAIVLNAWCLYCILSALTSTLIFIYAIYTYRRYCKNA